MLEYPKIRKKRSGRIEIVGGPEKGQDRSAGHQPNVLITQAIGH